ncbi:MAG: PSD1 and planctomycete cytochrome C domain-containing protein [Mariniblastus sp.]|nr:PSD1 and planctomycete cytochrome C domain-containing protein [Mariniblastus sp.]
MNGWQMGVGRIIKKTNCLIPIVAILCLVSTQSTGDEISFTSDVRPILAAKCFNCHGFDAGSRQGDLRLDRRDEAEYVFSGAGDTALFWERINSDDLEFRMPPPESKEALSLEEIEILNQWLSQGSPYEEHWAFRAPVRPTVPLVESEAIRNPIDSFIRARLIKQGMTPSNAADPVTLARRLSQDLHGLPPAANVVEEFANQSSDKAYSDLIDVLMASPRYGEHMAVPWLDAARYADTDGYQNDRYRYMHVWRDWVIHSLNENMPYDQFVLEQVAGDMLPDATLKQQIATGFCRNHRINSEDGSIPEEWHVENVVDRIDTIGTAILGLTVGCARCHDHKFDPISAKEYYQLFAYFNNVPEWGVGPNNGNSPPFIEVPKSWPNLSEDENVAILPAPLKLREARKGQMGNGLKRPQAGSPQTVMVMHEMKVPRATYLLMRGQFDSPDKSELLTPGVPKVLLSSLAAQPQSRLQFAQWLVDRENPLTARVAVNRVWQQIFGMGLVKTSENFGTQGELPSHPELLDWLAVELIESGWDIRHIQKLILQSTTYRQSSETTPAREKEDPENRFLARAPRYRLHAFALRDSLLASSGLLVEKIGGIPAKPYMPPKIWRAISNNTYKQGTGDDLYRRSVYTFWRRTIPPPMMVNFNSADREVCIVRKDRTNTPLQALTQMNNIAFVEAARFLAERMIEHSVDPRIAIEFGFISLVSRKPRKAELILLLDAYSEFEKHYRAQPKAAKALLSVGQKKRNENLELTEHAALTMVASLLMNLDEAVTRE